jgi:hypothetical protein
MRRSELLFLILPYPSSDLKRVDSNKSLRYHVERLLREVIIPRLAPVSREMCLNYISEKVLDLPKSY